MAEPPRLPAILLPWEKWIIYFVTIFVKDRRKVLATPEVFEAIKTTIPLLQKWNVLAGVIMPGHVHRVVSPVKDRGLSVGDFLDFINELPRQGKLSASPTVHGSWGTMREAGIV